MKWNIFVVSGEWFFVCVVSGILVFIDDYLLVEGILVIECRSDVCLLDYLDDDKIIFFGEDVKIDNVGVV